MANSSPATSIPTPLCWIKAALISISASESPVSAVWEIPALKSPTGFKHQLLGGWSLTPIWTAETGQPHSIFDCSNDIYVCPRAEFAGPVPINGPATLRPWLARQTRSVIFSSRLASATLIRFTEFRTCPRSRPE